MAKKSNFQIIIEDKAQETGNSLDEQLCDALFCESCPHDRENSYPYKCCYGLFADMFSTDLHDRQYPLGCSDGGR